MISPEIVVSETSSLVTASTSAESRANVSLGERSQESPDQRRQGRIGSCGPSTGRSEVTSYTGARVSGPKRPVLGPLLDAEFTGYASRSPARRPIRIHDRCKGHLIPPIAPVEALAAVSVPQSSNAATLVSSAASAQVGGSSSF
jgi:hypothetical protein